MAGQIGEYISEEKLDVWTDIESKIKWLGTGSNSSNSFEEGKLYLIYNNSATSFKFVCTTDLDETTFGSYVNQGSMIYFKPTDDEKIYIKGTNFNLAISEVK